MPFSVEQPCVLIRLLVPQRGLFFREIEQYTCALILMLGRSMLKG
jgi:hypothetical protein